MIDQRHLFSRNLKILLWTFCLVGLIVSCSDLKRHQIDTLNEKAYSFRYRNLDSTQYYANKVLKTVNNIGYGYAEALNNLAFVHIAKMQYSKADSLLRLVERNSNNQIELLIADIQMMRLCQRISKNKDFYVYRESAMSRLKRINEESKGLDNHQRNRMIYARSEFNITNSTYFYYVGLENQSIDAINQIDDTGEILQDTAQYLNYLYSIGSGGIIVNGTQAEINQAEFDYLIRCNMLARQFHYPYWIANSMQAISEHLQKKEYRTKLIRENLPSFQYLNNDNMPDSLLAGNLAQKSLNIFNKYGDVYQVAGAYRTLAECYWHIQDYTSALICLKNALETNKAIEQAPDLVASIREQLSLTYSAINNKRKSDYNRNIYLDIQEETRQDRQLEARAEQLNLSSVQLNRMILAIVLMIVIVCVLLYIFYVLRKRNDQLASNLDDLLKPLERWKIDNATQLEKNKNRCSEIEEDKHLTELQILKNKKRNLEQRTKVSLVNSITPLIDRILHEIKRLTTTNEDCKIRQERYDYIAELANQINNYNNVLTNWIQLRQGILSLKIESFPLQDVFDILLKSKMSFNLKGIKLLVDPTQAIVKADKTLTLFMMNTLSDNAKKFTLSGGYVHIHAEESNENVMIYVEDSGVGMDERQVQNLFVNKPIMDKTFGVEYNNGENQTHVSNGFGLMNCKGIIDRYKKISKIFDVCSIGAKSEIGKGSTLFFSLPKGLKKKGLTFLLFLVFVMPFVSNQNQIQAIHPARFAQSSGNLHHKDLVKANAFADSVYHSNIKGTFIKTLSFADSCIYYLNKYYRHTHHPGNHYMVLVTTSTKLPAELKWLHDSISTNYNVILSLRNEVAVAALALHDWQLYAFNNKVYTQLFRELSADNTLGTYVKTMQRSETNKNVSVIILSLIFASIFPAFYFLYYRHRVFYQFSIDKINGINQILLSDFSSQDKLEKIEHLWTFNTKMFNPQFPKLNEIVEQIKESLRQRISMDSQQLTNIELSEDELRRMEYEKDKLYVSNNVLDNCLSTLKHETMYYPSKIRKMVNGNDDNLNALEELASYYKELYVLLSAQAMRQIENTVKVDFEMLDYLFDILREQNGGELNMSYKDIEEPYSVIEVEMTHLVLTDKEMVDLFTPNTINMQYMLCRQIVREIGDATNARACGIQAFRNENNIISIHIKLTRTICEHLKQL